MLALTGFVALSLFTGLVLTVFGLMQWKQSPRQTWRCLALGAVFQLWWIVPAVWWISHNVKNYVEFGIKR